MVDTYGHADWVPYLAYAGVGSRQTPADVLDLMVRAGMWFAERGYTLRTGAAEGADQSFMEGCALAGAEGGLAEIYLPWKTFWQYDPDSLPIGFEVIPEPTTDALLLASTAHPNWKKLAPGARKLHARNVHQVLGRDCETPAQFVLCWTPGGSGSGGTGQAIRIAREHGIQVIDLGKPAELQRVRERLESAPLL